MSARRFVRTRRERWSQLEELLDRAQIRGVRSLGGEEVRRLGALYRELTTDLATARTLELDRETIEYLNRLTYAAHDVVYAGRRRARGIGVWEFLRTGFADVVVRTWTYHATAAAIFVVSAALAFAVLAGNQDLAERSPLAGLVDRAREALAVPPEQRLYIELPEVFAPLFSWGIIANNVQVTLIAFGLGALLFGLGTVFILVVNGLSVGGAVAVYHNEGIAELILTFMAGHGPLELAAIFIAGGAGMRLGLSLVLPGQRSRLRALQETGLDSVRLLGGTTVMLLLAGLIEGFVSPAALPPSVKWGVGLATGIGFALYLAAAVARTRRVSSQPRSTGQSGRIAE